jgi:hypothetical protein
VNFHEDSLSIRQRLGRLTFSQTLQG